ncbi:hypothetical protein ACTA71_004573 [Dictyostelium dimigraforme]
MSTVGDKDGMFFEQKNFEGGPWLIKGGGRYNFYSNGLRSIKVGKLCKIKAWDNFGTMKSYTPGEYPDITYDLRDIKLVQALDVDCDYSVDIKFNHKINGIPADDAVEIASGANYTSVQIPQLNPPDAEIVCQVSIRETAWPGQTVANGSIYFKYDSSNNTISYRKTEGWPNNCEIVQDDVTGFTITLNSI